MNKIMFSTLADKAILDQMIHSQFGQDFMVLLCGCWKGYPLYRVAHVYGKAPKTVEDSLTKFLCVELNASGFQAKTMEELNQQIPVQQMQNSPYAPDPSNRLGWASPTSPINQMGFVPPFAQISGPVKEFSDAMSNVEKAMTEWNERMAKDINDMHLKFKDKDLKEQEEFTNIVISHQENEDEECITNVTDDWYLTPLDTWTITGSPVREALDLSMDTNGDVYRSHCGRFYITYPVEPAKKILFIQHESQEMFIVGVPGKSPEDGQSVLITPNPVDTRTSVMIKDRLFGDYPIITAISPSVKYKRLDHWLMGPQIRPYKVGDRFIWRFSGYIGPFRFSCTGNPYNQWEKLY